LKAIGKVTLESPRFATLHTAAIALRRRRAQKRARQANLVI
jgi:hypothetical protein